MKKKLITLVLASIVLTGMRMRIRIQECFLTGLYGRNCSRL